MVNESPRCPALPLNALTTGVLVAAAALLALDPALWLIGTWQQAGYDGVGWLAFALVAGLFVWSLASPLEGDLSASAGRTYLLLATTAVIRLAAQLLDVNVIGALLLGVDVFALARLAGLSERRRALSPLWLALLFCFSLPIEPMLQRVFGYALQQVSAQLACGLLMPFFATLSCAGVRLQVDGSDVLVDLPCSGAELVSITALVFAVINTIRRPSRTAAVLGSLACLGLALIGNGVRIAILAGGIAKAEALPFHVMDPMPHAMIGLAIVGVVSITLLELTRRLPVAAAPHADARKTRVTLALSERALRIPYAKAGFLRDDAAPQSGTLKAALPRDTTLRARRRWSRLVFSCAFLAFALMVGAVQPQPMDASAPLSSPEIPLVAAGLFAEASPLTEQEQHYFTRYGGAATRASFGPFGLLLVSTTSPLRHLHDPTVCLTGMGYAVTLVGTDHVARSTFYLAERNAGAGGNSAERYTVRVSYRSNAGQVASSIAEVVWHWLETPTGRWTMVQRVVPDHPAINPDTAEQWEDAMRRAFNLS